VVTARLDLKVAGLVQGLSTRNTLDRPRRLHMHLVEGPMRALEGVFTFQALGDHGCKVSLALDFDYPGRLGAAALRLGFKVLADRMVDDFCRVADALYG
jgi:ribosome-associated toxin RatA of RatAB toxin-antitoxin module